MTHDEMCPMTEGKAHPLWKAAAPIHELLCQCDLIARVRADERGKARERVEYAGRFFDWRVVVPLADAAGGAE